MKRPPWQSRSCFAASDKTKMPKSRVQVPLKSLRRERESHAEKGINGETESEASEADSNGKEKAAVLEMRPEAPRWGPADGRLRPLLLMDPLKSLGRLGMLVLPAPPLAAAAPGSAKSKFFEDDEESEEGEEVEEGSEGRGEGIQLACLLTVSTLGLCNDQGLGRLYCRFNLTYSWLGIWRVSFVLYSAFHNTHFKAALHKMNGLPSLTSLLHFIHEADMANKKTTLPFKVLGSVNDI